MRNAQQVYISSTLADLSEYRAEAIKIILGLDAVPVSIEGFDAQVDDAAEVCANAVRSSDLVVLILGHRYGVIPIGSSVSFVELEFDVARESNTPILAFIVDDDYAWQRALIDSGESLERLRSFTDRVQSMVVAERFTSPSDLALRLRRALLSFRRTDESQRNPQNATESDVAEPTVVTSPVEFMVKIEEHLQTLHARMEEVQLRLDSSTVSHQSEKGHQRHSINPPAFLGPMSPEVEANVCFVAMPFSKTWSDAVQSKLTVICEKSGFTPVVANDMTGRSIHNDIWVGITRSAVVVADITDGNPNVAYEIGLADVLGKEVILLCQGENVPFDFQGQRLIIYEDSMKGAVKLEEELTARLRRLRV